MWTMTLRRFAVKKGPHSGGDIKVHPWGYGLAVNVSATIEQLGSIERWGVGARWQEKHSSLIVADRAFLYDPYRPGRIAGDGRKPGRAQDSNQGVYHLPLRAHVTQSLHAAIG